MPSTYDLTTDIGKIRLALGDNNFASGRGVKPDYSNFTDEELQIFLTAEGTVGRATAAACEALATAWGTVTDITVGARSESLSKVAAHYGNYAAKLRAVHGGSAKAFSAATKRTDAYTDAAVTTE